MIDESHLTICIFYIYSFSILSKYKKRLIAFQSSLQCIIWKYLFFWHKTWLKYKSTPLTKYIWLTRFYKNGISKNIKTNSEWWFYIMLINYNTALQILLLYLFSLLYIIICSVYVTYGSTLYHYRTKTLGL